VGGEKGFVAQMSPTAHHGQIHAIARVGAGDGNANASASTYTGNLAYAAGPLKVSANYNQSTITDEFKAALGALNVSDARLVSYDISAIYDAGVAKFGMSIDGPRRFKQNGTDDNAYLSGVSVPLGAFTVGGNYAVRASNSLLNVGVTYDLSKRTSMNASWGTYTTAGKALNGTDLVQDTYRMTINHSF
jgi:predicted porin